VGQAVSPVKPAFTPAMDSMNAQRSSAPKKSRLSKRYRSAAPGDPGRRRADGIWTRLRSPFAINRRRPQHITNIVLAFLQDLQRSSIFK
jgi:hypothetical protein